MVEWGDNSTYSIQGVGATSFQLNSGDTLHMQDILYVPGLKKNLFSISILEDKGFCVILMKNQAYLWPKNHNLDTAIVFGIQDLHNSTTTTLRVKFDCNNCVVVI